MTNDQIQLLIQELNRKFELNTYVLDQLIRERGDNVKFIDWSNVKNVYSVSNLYNQVCRYKQLDLMYVRSTKIHNAIVLYAVNAILDYLEDAPYSINLKKDSTTTTTTTTTTTNVNIDINTDIWFEEEPAPKQSNTLEQELNQFKYEVVVAELNSLKKAHEQLKREFSNLG